MAYECLYLFCLFFVGSFALPSANSPRGLFIQVGTANSSWVLLNLDRWLANICAQNPRITNDIVLQDVAIEDGNGGYIMLYSILDIIVPYLPGGSKECFGNVFVGTIEVAYSGNPYLDGIQDPVYRQKNVDLSRKVVQEFRNRYPRCRPIQWYITFEANLNYLTNNEVLAGYEDLLVNTIQGLQSVESVGNVMWSPTFWSTSNIPVDEMTKLRTNLRYLFNTVQTRAPPGINWMNFQDSLGKATQPKCTGVTSTVSDVVNYYRLLASIFTFRSLQVNEEQFQYNEQCQLIEGKSEVLVQQEQEYAKENVRLGAAWEIRFWQHKDELM